MAPTGRTYRSFGTPRPSNGYPAGTEASVDLQVNLSTGNVSPSEANAAESGENMESTGERSQHVESTTLISRSAEANRWQIPSGVCSKSVIIVCNVRNQVVSTKIGVIRVSVNAEICQIWHGR